MGLCHGTSTAIDVEQQSTPQRSHIHRGRPTETTSADRPTGSASLPSGDSTLSSNKSKSTRRAHLSPSSDAKNTNTTAQRSLLNGVVDPADVISVLDERVDHVVNQFTSAELLQIQRHVRSITRAIRDMPTSTTAAALITMGRGITSASLLPNTKTALSKHCKDEAVLRRVFAAGVEQFHRGMDEWSKWKKTMHSVSSNSTSSSKMPTTEQTSPETSHPDSSSFDSGVVKSAVAAATSTHGSTAHPYPSGKYKADPVGSIYVLLLACSEARWDNYAAASAAIIARTVAAEEGGTATTAKHSSSGSSTQDTKHRRSNSGLVPFRTGNNDSGTNEEGTGNNSYTLPPGISFLMLCYCMAIAAKSTNRKQKLLLLFHALVPPKQLRSVLLHQQPNSAFPSYMFEIGFVPQELFLSVTSREVHPSKLSLKVSSAVALDTIASLLLVSMYGRHGVEGNTAAASSAASYTQGECDMTESIPELCALYELCTEDLLWSYDDFIAWANSGALDDDMIDSILRTLFLTGILTSAEQELQMVRERWLEWQMEEYERRDCAADAWSDGTCVKSGVESGTKKKYSGIWGLVNGISSDPAPAVVNGIGDIAINTTYKKARKVWGGIGNIDGFGGLGNGVLYCIDTRWWDEWVKFSGWHWDSSSDFRRGELDSKSYPCVSLMATYSKKIFYTGIVMLRPSLFAAFS